MLKILISTSVSHTIFWSFVGDRDQYCDYFCMEIQYDCSILLSAILKRQREKLCNDDVNRATVL